jgi:hypothetical protein
VLPLVVHQNKPFLEYSLYKVLLGGALDKLLPMAVPRAPMHSTLSSRYLETTRKRSCPQLVAFPRTTHASVAMKNEVGVTRCTTVKKLTGAPMRAIHARFSAGCSVLGPGAAAHQVPLDAMGPLASIAQLQRQRQQQHTRRNVDGRASGAHAREHVGGRCAPVPWSFLVRQSAILPAERYEGDGGVGEAWFLSGWRKPSRA